MKKNQDYKQTLPWLIHFAKARGDLFDSTEQQLKFISLLEGCKSESELRGILNFPECSKFAKVTITTME